MFFNKRKIYFTKKILAKLFINFFIFIKKREEYYKLTELLKK